MFSPQTRKSAFVGACINPGGSGFLAFHRNEVYSFFIVFTQARAKEILDEFDDVFMIGERHNVEMMFSNGATLPEFSHHPGFEMHQTELAKRLSHMLAFFQAYIDPVVAAKLRKGMSTIPDQVIAYSPPLPQDAALPGMSFDSSTILSIKRGGRFYFHVCYTDDEVRRVLYLHTDLIPLNHRISLEGVISMNRHLTPDEPSQHFGVYMDNPDMPVDFVESSVARGFATILLGITPLLNSQRDTLNALVGDDDDQSGGGGYIN